MGHIEPLASTRYTLSRVASLTPRRQMGNDANYYSDADAFRPERFIDPATGLSTGLDPKDYIFSFGRRYGLYLTTEVQSDVPSARACPGQRFADDSLWLVIASIIATFDIKRTVDDNGREVTPPMAFSPGLTRFVKYSSREAMIDIASVKLTAIRGNSHASCGPVRNTLSISSWTWGPQVVLFGRQLNVVDYEKRLTSQRGMPARINYALAGRASIPRRSVLVLS